MQTWLLSCRVSSKFGFKRQNIVLFNIWIFLYKIKAKFGENSHFSLVMLLQAFAAGGRADFYSAVFFMILIK